MRGVLDAIKKLFFSPFILSEYGYVSLSLYVCVCDHIRREYIKSNFCRSPWQIINGRNYGTIILKRNGPLRISNSREATKQWIARTISWVHHLRLRGMCYSMSALIHTYLLMWCVQVVQFSDAISTDIPFVFFLHFSAHHQVTCLHISLLSFVQQQQKTESFLHFTSENN